MVVVRAKLWARDLGGAGGGWVGKQFKKRKNRGR